jgi:N-acetylglucosamine-6-phosphate deacetylase
MNDAKLIITNCRLLNSPTEDNISILVKGGKIESIGKIDTAQNSIRLIDAGGRVVAPGFIDVHIQGAGGADILDGTEDALRTISKTAARFGTTSLLATTVFYPNGDNSHIDVAAKNIGANLEGARIIGIHLEGPFISLGKRGMIQRECICPVSLKIFDDIQERTAGQLKMMTIAPELKQADQIISKLIQQGVIPSFGHSAASFEQATEGFDAGICHVTHLFNAMNSLHHRSPGPFIAMYQRKPVTMQIITDGVHIAPEVLRFTTDILGYDRLITITDGICALGLPDGKYLYRGLKYESKDGSARYADGTLIGTALGLSQLLQRLIHFTGSSLAQAIKTVTENPAKLLGIEHEKGSIAIDKDADIVILNSDNSVWKTIVSGKVVFSQEETPTSKIETN